MSISRVAPRDFIDEFPSSVELLVRAVTEPKYTELESLKKVRKAAIAGLITEPI
jgi:hypothetical protein